jgi:NAD(P)-dependent dehydrogenase (short-subunit alcohol dehydrogenase family)
MFLKNKTAVVTGGSKGIGYAVAESLLSEGASVMICARKESELKSAVERLSKRGNAAGVICDVRDDAQVRETLDKCVGLVWRRRYPRQQRGDRLFR